MKTLHNLTRAPLRVPLPGGKVLHLGPGKTGTVSDAAIESPGVQRLLRSKSIEVLGSAEGGPNEPGGSSQGPHESTHGHPPPTVVTPRGNR